MKKIETCRMSQTFPEIWSVSNLSRMIVEVCEMNFSSVWVCGEVSSITMSPTGHWYFTIKDKWAQLRCIMFRSAAQKVIFEPKIGDKVEICAVISFYQLRGDLQLAVEVMRKKGQGSFFEEFMKIKERLASEGLFDKKRKKRIPKYPRIIGVVTSYQAAALHDVLTTIKRRAPHIKIVHYDAPVQGIGAAKKIALQINRASRIGLVDVLILCRGGGSVEDLSVFNDEYLAREIAKSSIPIVAGIGHELDFTIADFVADLRAPTPTAAAEMASPDYWIELQRLANISARMSERICRILNEAKQSMGWMSRQLKNSFLALTPLNSRLLTLKAHCASLRKISLRNHHQSIKSIQDRLKAILPSVEKMRFTLGEIRLCMIHAANDALFKRHRQIELLKQRLDLLHPNEILNRGYTFISCHDGIDAVYNVKNLRKSMRVKIHFSDGFAVASIESITLNP